jgi:hypothetical protein
MIELLMGLIALTVLLAAAFLFGLFLGTEEC